MLTEEFFNRPTLEVARDMLGTILVHNSPGGKTSGIVVETEAYLGDDPACHASRGKTRRNATMFGPPGRAYVYLVYGIHYCFNAVTMPPGIGEAVLVRALEPVEGVNIMKKRRGIDDIRLLCSGPARLCQAMGLDKQFDGIGLTDSCLHLRQGATPPKILTTTRVGISRGQELPYRFYIAGSRWISRK